MPSYIDHIPWHVKCGAKKRNGLPCENWALRGANRCRLHGGASPQAKRSAERRLRQLAELCLVEAVQALKAHMANPRVSATEKARIAFALLELSGVNVSRLDDPVDSAHPGESVI